MIAVAQKMCGSYSEPRGERRGFFICSGYLTEDCSFPLVQLSPAQQMQSKIKREKSGSVRRSSRGHRTLPNAPISLFAAFFTLAVFLFTATHFPLL